MNEVAANGDEEGGQPSLWTGQLFPPIASDIFGGSSPSFVPPSSIFPQVGLPLPASYVGIAEDSVQREEGIKRGKGKGDQATKACRSSFFPLSSFRPSFRLRRLSLD